MKCEHNLPIWQCRPCAWEWKRESILALFLRYPRWRPSSAARVLGMRAGTAHQQFKRLERRGLVKHVRHGIWSLADAA